MTEKLIATLPNVVRRVVHDPRNGGEREFFVGTLRSDLAKALTFVPVNESSSRTYLREELEDGYQRPGSAARMKKFAEYVQENPLSVVPPVIISGRSRWKFTGKGEVGALEIYGPAAVVDGQHRLGGYVYLYETEELSRDIDFFLLADLSLDEEKEEFLAINNTQRGVPKSLNVLLEGSDDALVASELDSREDSPFKGRIKVAKSKPNVLFSLAAVHKNVGRTFEHGAFTDLGVDMKIDLFIEYWTRIQDAFPDEWADIDKPASEREYKLLETTGLIAWSLAASDLLGPAFDHVTKTMNWDAVEAKISQHLRVPGALDWRKDGEFQGLTGEVGGARIHKKMQQLLASHLNLDEQVSVLG